ncbi:MAG: CHASE domain-containing protein [Novosphingobium sp.]
MRAQTEPDVDRDIDGSLLARVEKQAWFHRYPRGWPLMLFFITSMFTAVSVMAIERADRQRREIELDRNLTEIASGLQRRAAENIALLRAGAVLFGSRDKVTPPEFEEFAAGLYGRGEFHGAIGMGWAPLLQIAQVPAFEQTIRAGQPAYRVHPALDRSRKISTPVVYVTPLNAITRPAVGYDMYSEPARRAAMDEALRREQPIATGPLQLVRNEQGSIHLGFLIYMPVFRFENGRRIAAGFVYSPFRADEFLDAAAALFRSREVEIAIYDLRREPERLLAWRHLPGENGASLDRSITVAGRNWILHVRAKRSGALTTLSIVTLSFGVVTGLLIMFTAWLITRRAAQDRQVFEWLTGQAAIRTSLTRELNHRVKNTLANVLSIVSLTRRRASDLDEFADGLTARLRALSATHDLLSQSDWTEAAIGDIVRSEVAPYMADGECHIDMSGPAINLAPSDALSLGLAIHELATNAAKYGALCTANGRVVISWMLSSPGIAEVHWQEQGGPAVAMPAKRGFGRDLIEKIVAHELQSKVELRFLPEGVECRLHVPVRRIAAFNLRSEPRAQVKERTFPTG